MERQGDLSTRELANFGLARRRLAAILGIGDLRFI